MGNWVYTFYPSFWGLWLGVWGLYKKSNVEIFYMVVSK